MNQSKKTRRIVGTIIFLLIIAGVSFAVYKVLNPSKYIFSQHTLNYIYNESTNKTQVISNTTAIEDKISGSIINEQSNIEGNFYVVLSNRKGLYSVTNDNIKQIAESAISFALSSNNKTVIYIDTDNTLYKYSNNEYTYIASNVLENSIALSPDGETILYIDLETNVLHMINKDKNISVGKDLVGIAVSNKSKQLYVYDKTNSTLYSMLPEKEKKIVGSNIGDKFLLNKDHSQIIFSSESKSYILINGEKSYTVSETTSTTPIIPSAVKPTTNVMINNTVSTYGIHTFGNVFFEDTNSSCTFLNKKFILKRVFDLIDANSIKISNDGSLLTFTIDQKLHYVHINNIKVSTHIADKVMSFAVSDKKDTVYYLNSSNELWEWNINYKKYTHISNDVQSFLMTKDSDVLLLNGSTLNRSNGNKITKIADDVYYISEYINMVYYYVINDSNSSKYNMYGSKETDNFKLILESTVLPLLPATN